jgi:hypothetical protein
MNHRRLRRVSEAWSIMDRKRRPSSHPASPIMRVSRSQDRNMRASGRTSLASYTANKVVPHFSSIQATYIFSPTRMLRQVFLHIRMDWSNTRQDHSPELLHLRRNESGYRVSIPVSQARAQVWIQTYEHSMLCQSHLTPPLRPA